MQEKVCFFLSLAQFKCSLPRRYSHPPSFSPSLCVLHMSLRDSATAVCFTVSVGGISGIPVCGRGLLHGSPSICRLSQSCTLLPSLPLSPNLSLCAVTCSKISLFHLALPCFTLFFKQRDISQSVIQMMTDRELRHLLP